MIFNSFSFLRKAVVSGFQWMQAAELAGSLVGEPERLGRPIGMADTTIAAIFPTHGLEVVMSNSAHILGIR